ncbi:RagB/SusD family nutrient uptake outer membrane protein [Plebeiibacterium marinum]|uniref:RagB/SusD family nutrient uptake outer membrane protein n=1 Tax=Plebeiibacterium marinum TaxID=2992111 RepID=A0AAE3MAW9_9BACT|nr:RagB/SusD family nutrient uptake outer membrane protein [Plebeiobacterium marinum]MCW3804461.1 RagB/SusD family nutrient uptake outer membrane protein [Plebeiobacterium marinum]
MINKIKIFSILSILAGIFGSCGDYLDSDEYFKDRVTDEKIFSSKLYSEEWLAHTYSFLKNECADVSSKGYTPHCFADDMYYGDRDIEYDNKETNSLSYNQFHMGSYDENTKQDTWTQCYKGIRNASIFIKNIDINEDLDAEGIADYKAQARFVRAYYYWLLLRKYGPIPLLPDEGIDYTDSYEDIALPRNSYEECAAYISSEMVLAARDLKTYRDEQSIGRPTRGAALATRAMVLLYAASPLANGNTDGYAQQLTDDEGRLLLSTEYNEEKWAKAAAAAKDVIELGVYDLYVASYRTAGTSSFPATITPPENAEFSNKDWPEGWANIDPFESYRAVFNGTVSASDNPELIFTRGNNGGETPDAMVAHQLPRIASGWNTHGLTQKQCDAYYMNDGTDCPGKDKEIGRGDGSERVTGYVTAYDAYYGNYKPLAKGVSLQYANREPRFYASVAYNGSVWHLENESEEVNREQQVFYYRGDKDGNGYTNTMFWLRTGIGVMKFVHPRDTYENGDINNVVDKTEPAIRYADVLLMYAEALNELSGSYSIQSWDGSQTYAISRDVNEMAKGIKPVRIRAGVPDYSADVYSDQDLFRKKLKRERQIELMGEGKRYYDLRRWKDAPVEESIQIYGCNVLMTSGEKDLFHTPVAAFALQSTFSEKMWFWPIKHEELRRNERLTQNPGWTYYN